VAAFAAPRKDLVWSSYRGSWQQLPVETHGGSWPVAIIAILAIIFGPMAYIGGVIWLFAAGLGWIGERVLELTASAVVVGLAIWAARRMVPRFAEFDGQVIRQTFIEHDEDPDEYRVVVDDGAAPTAWDLKVPAGSGPRVPADARPVPGVGGGFLLGQSAMLYAGSCITAIGVHGAGLPGMDTADEAALIRLLALVSARLPGLVIRP
jgi:hypothetical protein